MIHLEAVLHRIAEATESSAAAPLARLVRVIRPRRGESPSNAVERVRTLNELLARRPDLARALRRHLEVVLGSRYQRFAYAESGILANEGFLSAVSRRVLARVLPAAPDDRFLDDLVSTVFDRPDDHVWLEAVPETVWQELRELLCGASAPSPALRIHAQREMMEALRILSHRLGALGLAPELVRYHPALAEHESPFLAQNEETIAYIRSARMALVDRLAQWPDVRHIHVLLDQCLAYVARIRRRSRIAGVSVHLTYLLARIEQIVARQSLLLRLLAPEPSLQISAEHTRFLIGLVRQENRRHAVGDLVRDSLQLTARQVTEHASKTGEHYVTETSAEYWAMFRAAVGAGLIVSALALFKVLIAGMHLPPLWEALGFSLNYGLGFVVVHLLHFTIATKQPAMTAATLAASLDRARTTSERVDVLAELSAKVCRTQWIAILGNVAACFAASLAVSSMLHNVLHVDPIGPQKAAHLIADLNPLTSWVVPHAAIAGVFLFLAGLVSGYCDNVAIYHRVPERLRRLAPLRTLLGPRRLRRLSRYLRRDLGALAGLFAFGLMLGSTALVGILLGIPLDPRHVTFATANLAYALATPGVDVGWTDAVAAAAGVALVGATNVAVSFWLAIRVALRSRNATAGGSRELAAHVLARLRARPREFFWPPSDPPTGDSVALAATADLRRPVRP